MNQEQFEQEASSNFPATAEEIADHAGLLHLEMGTLYRYTLDKIRTGEWRDRNGVRSAILQFSEAFPSIGVDPLSGSPVAAHHSRLLHTFSRMEIPIDEVDETIAI